MTADAPRIAFQDRFAPFGPRLLFGSLLATAALIPLLPRFPYLLIALALLVVPFLRPRAARTAVYVLFTITCIGWVGNARFRVLRLDSHRPDGYYGQLLEGFKAGELGLLQRPDPRMGELKNPYSQQSAFLHPPPDISYWDDRYYVYWGVAPVLTFVLPYHLLSVGHYPTELLQGWWFASLAVLAFFFAGRKWLDARLRRESTPVEEFLLYSALLFCTVTGPSARFLDVYRTAVFAGLAYAGIALYLIQYRRLWSDALAGLSCALVLASRPTLAPIVLPVLALRFSDGVPRPWQDGFLRPVAYFLYGLIPASLATFWYNFARFGDPFEFGQSYQISLWDFHDWTLDWTSLGLGTWAGLFQPYTMPKSFPPIVDARFGEGWLALHHRYMTDYNVGLLIAAPFVALAIGAHWRRRFRRDDLVFYALYLVALVNLLACAARAGITYRFTMSSSSLAVLAAAVFLLSQSRPRRGWVFVALVSLWFSVAAGFFLTLAPDYLSFRIHHPDADRALRWLSGAPL